MAKVCDAQGNYLFQISSKTLRLMLKVGDKIRTRDTMKIVIIWGDPGSGKSVLSQKLAYAAFNQMLPVKNIAFNKAQFVNAVTTSRKEAVIADEGLSILFSRAAMSKEGRVIVELMGEMRQQNLLVIVNVWDILSVDSLIVRKANLGLECFEYEKMINGRPVTIKGNARVYPNFKKNRYLEKIVLWLKRKNTNPMYADKKPHYWDMITGDPYGEDFKPAFYATDREAYLKEKNSILKKFTGIFERKKHNHKPNYKQMDKLLSQKISRPLIAQILNVSPATIERRAKEIREIKKTINKNRLSSKKSKK